MKNDSSFGVVLLAEGQETIGAVQTQATGTLATISDWYQGEDGLLGITAMGGNRFRLLSAQQQDDGLNLGSIEILPPEPEVPMPGDYAVMADLLRAVMHDIGDLYAGVERNFDDASWVGYRFAEIQDRVTGVGVSVRVVRVRRGGRARRASADSRRRHPWWPRSRSPWCSRRS